MASADMTLLVNIADLPEVRELIDSSRALDQLLSRSYEPTSMSAEYQRWHDALQKFVRPEQ